VTLRAGGCGEGVLQRLHWIRKELAPVLGAALERMGGLPLDEVFRWALQMGDELHSRNVAATGVVIQKLLPHLAAAASGAGLVDVCRFLTEDNPQFFLNFGIAAARAILDAARDIPGSSLVTDLASNGLWFGLRVSGLGARWFTAPLDPAMLDEVTYFQGFSKADANPLIGGSFLMEALGLGALVQVNAPALLKSTAGLTIAQALALGEEMAGITWGRNPNFPVGALDFQGAPLGIDVIKVVERRCPPIMNFAVCSRHPGQGRIIGYGKSRAPLACFEAACRALQGEGP
ncbi:MAG: DUF1116 domain-containing protein, partial [Deltaproteobacteria bacterium]|nr:DUF1116 domain-containing protein [Deltaproteobacteria bacterium]